MVVTVDYDNPQSDYDQDPIGIIVLLADRHLGLGITGALAVAPTLPNGFAICHDICDAQQTINRACDLVLDRACDRLTVLHRDN